MHGKHIKVLGRGDPGRLGNPTWVEMLLRKIVETAGMRELASVVKDVELEIGKLGKEPFEDEGGVSGIMLLSTSHVAVHTWPLRKFFVFDLYSCRDFNDHAVKEVIRLHFMASALMVHDLSSSLDYPA